MNMKRRDFLLGAGGAFIGLPFLESLAPRSANGADAVPPSFAIFIRHPHGVVNSHWWPSKLGNLSKDVMPDDFACSKMLEHMSRTVYLKNLKMGFPNRNCHHNIHALQLFTGSEPRYSTKQGDALASSESMEWTIAKQFHPTVDPLVLFAGNRKSFLNDTTSFREDGSKVVGENDPLKVYNRIFGMASNTDTTDLLRLSVNDYVREQIKAMQKNTRLSASDKERLDLHFTTIRDVEKKIARTLPKDKLDRLNQLAGNKDALTDANNNKLDEVIRLQMDIIALAIAAGYVRGVNYQLLSGIDDTRFTLDGKQLPPSHGSSHREGGLGYDGDIGTLKRLDKLWQESIAYLATALSQDKINGKPLIDYGVIMAATEIADGQSHGENNVPHMLVGSCNGALKTGHYSDFGEITNKTLLATIGNALGLKNKGSMDAMNEFGASNHPKKGRIDQLLAKIA